jgi:PAS domain S-box-containing protein
MYANERAGRLFLLGDSTKEYLGRPAADFYVEPRERRALIDDVLQAGSVYDREVRLRRPDGAIVRYEVAARIITVDGIEATLAAFSDVTGRRAEQEETERSKTLFASMFRMSPAATILSILETGKCIDANDAYVRMCGYTREELVGRTTLELNIWYSAEDRARVIDNLTRYGRLSDVEIRIRRKDGTILTTIACGEKLTIEGKRYILSFFYDITERRQLEERLRQSERLEAIGRLAGGVAHDFNNQLAVITTSAELLKLELNGTPHQEDIDAILVSATRSAQLTSHLLSFARKGKVLSVPVDMSAMVEEVVQLLKRSVEKTVEIRVEAAASASTVNGDPAQLQNMLLNLGLNARDAMAHGGVLTIKTAVRNIDTAFSATYALDIEPGQYLELAVEDTGSGMGPELLPHIFDPFFTTKRDSGGTGLGLAAVYGAVRDHHGAVMVRSEPGKGSRFIVFLPLTDGIAAAPLPPASETPVKGTGRVLVAEDEEIGRTVLNKLLKILGYEVTLCTNGRDAVDTYRASPGEFDLIILDVNMPQMSGGVAFQEIKKINPEVKVLVVSGFSADGVVQQMIDEGAIGFMQKPFSITELSQVIFSAINGKT